MDSSAEIGDHTSVLTPDEIAYERVGSYAPEEMVEFEPLEVDTTPARTIKSRVQMMKPYEADIPPYSGPKSGGVTS